MSVASLNPFSLLSEETEAPSVENVKKEETKTDKTQAPQQAARGGQRGRGGAANKGGRYYQRGGAVKTQTREGAPEVDESAPPREERRSNGDAGRGRGRGGRGRGDRGGRGAPGGRGRPFDKHSQTGRTDTHKQIQQGWGSDEGKAELKAEEEGSKDAVTDSPAAPAATEWAEGSAPAEDGWGAPAPASGDAPAQEGATTPGGRRRPEEEEDNTLTLEEYLKQQKEKLVTVKLADVNVRKANEGEDVFEGAVLHAKDEEDAYFSGKSKGAPKQRAKTEKVKETIAYEGRFADVGRGFRGRGRGSENTTDARTEFRGRGRGGRGGRGGPREGGRGRAEANGSGNVDVADEAAFPSLGGKA